MAKMSTFKDSPKALEADIQQANTLKRGIDLEDVESPSAWSHRMMKKFHSLVIRCEGNSKTRKLLEEGIEKLNDAVSKELGIKSALDNDEVSNEDWNEIWNQLDSEAKVERNFRLQSVRKKEEQCRYGTEGEEV